MELNEIKSYYEAIRDQERRALEIRIEHANSLHPDFSRLMSERAVVRSSLTGAASTGRDIRRVATDANTALATIKEEETALLRELNLPDDYLDIHYRCTLCFDTGYVGEGRKSPCACLQKKLLEYKRSSSCVNEKETFANFDKGLFTSNAQLNQMLRAAEVAKEFAEQFPNTRYHNLVLTGMPGLGKSFLINSIASRVLERGFLLEKVTAYNFIQDILRGIRGGFDGAAPFINTPLLMIDDLGTEPMLNNITADYLFSILNERRNGQKHTIAATNLSFETLHDRYGERIFSRLIGDGDTGVIALTGENLRLCTPMRKGGA